VSRFDDERRIRGVPRERALHIIRAFGEGAIPSELDEAEGLPRGTTHALVVARWADANPRNRDGGRRDD
jgi:hypothetical protein